MDVATTKAIMNSQAEKTERVKIREETDNELTNEMNKSSRSNVKYQRHRRHHPKENKGRRFHFRLQMDGNLRQR